jgi:hypothetical protein
VSDIVSPNGCLHSSLSSFHFLSLSSFFALGPIHAMSFRARGGVEEASEQHAKSERRSFLSGHLSPSRTRRESVAVICRQTGRQMGWAAGIRQQRAFRIENISTSLPPSYPTMSSLSLSLSLFLSLSLSLSLSSILPSACCMAKGLPPTGSVSSSFSRD